MAVYIPHMWFSKVSENVRIPGAPSANLPDGLDPKRLLVEDWNSFIEFPDKCLSLYDGTINTEWSKIHQEVGRLRPGESTSRWIFIPWESVVVGWKQGPPNRYFDMGDSALEALEGILMECIFHRPLLGPGMFVTTRAAPRVVRMLMWSGVSIPYYEEMNGTKGRHLPQYKYAMERFAYTMDLLGFSYMRRRYCMSVMKRYYKIVASMNHVSRKKARLL